LLNQDFSAAVRLLDLVLSELEFNAAGVVVWDETLVADGV
jgi:hypothetical protein